MMHQDRIETPLRTPAHHLALHTPLPHLSTSADSDALIYSTTILLGKATAAVQRFILEFEETRMSDGELVSQQVYRIKLNDLEQLQEMTVFEIQGKHIREFDRELYLQLVYFPAQMISCFDTVIRDLYERYFIEPETDMQTRSFRQTRKEAILVGFKGLHEEQRVSVKELGPPQIGRLMTVRAIVIRVSEIFPEMKRAWFRCQNCGDEIHVDMLNARVQEPETCRVCFKKSTMQIMHNFCVFTDKQYVKLQELPELVTEGQTPSALTAIAYDSTVDKFRPGDRLQIVGIYRAQAAKVDRHKGTLRTLFNTYMDIISCSVLNEHRFGIQKKSSFSDEERRKFMRFADKADVLDNLVAAFAPSIFGHELIKKGILTQLFGGTKKEFPGKGATRADVNICLIGDPSTAKSQLLQQVHRIAPRSIYTSGRGSSAVGLTANVRKDVESRQFVLESGALVLADRGICCIDEFDKMDQSSRTILLEAMEQQTISIAKAGIVCQLNSRTAILAAANPIGSKYDLRRSVIDNIALPPSLISRFDLIYILLDIANEAADTKIATHILDFYIRGKPATSEARLSLQELTRYISYAREYVRPVLTQQAGNKLCLQYKSMRGKGLSNKTITATPRQLESLIRMSEAFARMRLSNQVTQADVEEAVSLMEKATLSTATDPETGIIDLDIITTGRSATLKKKVQELAHNLRQFLFTNQSKYRKQNHFDKLFAQFESFQHHKRLETTRDQLFEAMKILQADQLIVTFGQHKSNPQFRLMQNSEQ